MDRWQRVLRPRIGIVVFATFVWACADGPTEAPLQDTATIPGHRVIASITCSADVSAGSLGCEPMRPSSSKVGPQFLIVGGQDVFVTLTAAAVEYFSQNERFRADVTVTNRIVQTMGTLDGVTPDSVKVFFHTGPVVSDGTGTVTVANPDGLGAFTGTDQPYFGYAGLIDHLGVSEKRKWQWNVPATVVRFDFSVYVAAAVQYPDGWVEVTPATASITVGGSVPLTAVVYDVVGRTGGTVTWSSSDPNIASVDPGTGVVTGVDVGPVTITASTGGPEADGTAEITVTAP